MLKNGLIAFFGVLLAQIAWAQPNLSVQGTSGDLYIVHKVEAKETWYSIGRLYNLSPREIAPYNGTTLEKTLSIGEELRIPLNNSNFDQRKTAVSGEVLIPLYHQVKSQEWMFRISQMYNKVPVASLESWNNIKNEDLKVGTQLIIGFLKVKSDQSALAQMAHTVPDATAAVTPDPVTTNPTTTVPVTQIPDEKEKPVEKPVLVSSTTEEEMPAQSNTQTTISTTNKLVDHKGGYFKSQFKTGKKQDSGNSDVFKSTSGWSDGKYYALMNNVPVGSIISIYFPSTKKTVYAKVLGALPDMKESQGLMLRISDAAAAALGASNARFYVEVKY